MRRMGAQPQWGVLEVGSLVEADMPEVDTVEVTGAKTCRGGLSAVPFVPFDFRRESGSDQGRIVSQTGAQDDRAVRFQHR